MTDNEPDENAGGTHIVTDECPATGHRHVVEFYESDTLLAAMVAGFLAPALAEPGVAVVVATPAHRAAFEAALAASGIDVPGAAAGGRLVNLDAAEVLATFLVDGQPDPAAFDREIGGFLDRLAGDGRDVRVYGEMVALLWEGGDPAAAVALEDLWNGMATRHDFELLCAYRVASFDNEDDAQAFRRVCEQHAARPEQSLLAELAYADALTTVINRRAGAAGGPVPRSEYQRGRDRLVLAAFGKASQLMASPGGRVLGGIVANEVAHEPVDLEGVLSG